MEPFGYKSEYSLSLKILFLFNLHNVLCKACSRFIVGSLCDLTRNRSLPFQAEDIITNLSDYRLNTEEIDLLKNGWNFSIPPKFIKKTCVFPIWHDHKIPD